MILQMLLAEAYQREVALCSINPSLYKLSMDLYTREKIHSIIIRSQQNILGCISETR